MKQNETITHRFTIDGSAALESRLERVCQDVLAGVYRLTGPRLEALVLGGGYGRGQGGVLRGETGDQPYNDLEFYVFLRGARLLNDRWFRGALAELGERLSPEAGIHVEFKVDSLDNFRTRPISMFSYDLVSGHYRLFGSEDIFAGCEHHLASESIPISEATRLLFNRCSGLLLSKELLCNDPISSEQSDFIVRNVAKAQLALGDALLAAYKQYHWSLAERCSRLERLAVPQAEALLNAIRPHHFAGAEFKLHPQRSFHDRAELQRQHTEISKLGLQLWLWIESRRLRLQFKSAHDYAFSDVAKCPESSAIRNCLLNVRTFGPQAVLDGLGRRYPRERLFNALSLLLWNGEVSNDPGVIRHLQKQLRSDAWDWTGFVAAYKQIWPNYG
jgi:hypothetical protein